MRVVRRHEVQDESKTVAPVLKLHVTEALGGDSKPKAYSITTPLVLAILVTIAWHAFWWAWLDVQSPLRRSPPLVRSMPQLTYLSLGNEREQGGFYGDLRKVWSPVLFALPTSVGFSRLERSRDVNLAPSIETPNNITVSFDRSVQRALEDKLTSREQLKATVQKTLDTLPLASVEGRVFAASSRLVLPEVRVEYSREVAAAHPHDLFIPQEPALLGQDAWSAAAYIEIGEEGSVQHVLLQKPSTSPERDAWLVRALYQWRFEAQEAKKKGTVRFNYPGIPRPVSKRVNGDRVP